MPNPQQDRFLADYDEELQISELDEEFIDHEYSRRKLTPLDYAKVRRLSPSPFLSSRRSRIRLLDDLLC